MRTTNTSLVIQLVIGRHADSLDGELLELRRTLIIAQIDHTNCEQVLMKINLNHTQLTLDLM